METKLSVKGNRDDRSTHGYQQKGTAGGGNAERMGCAAADNPENPVVGIDKKELPLFVDNAVFMV